jgi:hypothetical protein
MQTIKSHSKTRTMLTRRLSRCLLFFTRTAPFVAVSLSAALLFAGTGPGPSNSPASPGFGVGALTGLVYEQDCNDPDNPLPTWICREAPKAFLPPGYPYYVGHDEPETQFFSTTPGSGNNLQWKIRLPLADPTPTQNGSVIANRELYPTFWFSLALCDPASTPFGACTPNSDTNTSASGSAILELQFYPPGSNCPGNDSKWCAAMTIDELTTNCGEPVKVAPITTDGTPTGPRLLMSPGDSILITIKESGSGLETDVADLTTATKGSMVASAAKGFTQTLETTHTPLNPVPPGTCSTAPFTYHPEYNTASPANNGSWINANVNFSFEIGHWELCGDAACTSKPDSSDGDDIGCLTVLGVGGCTGPDLDHDGTPYLADWPDGSASHPSSIIITNSRDNGIGPLSFSAGSYQAPYGTIFFQPDRVAGSFFPFFSQAGTGQSCVLNFGNDIPGVTVNDLGKAAQYGTTIANPCMAARVPWQPGVTYNAGDEVTFNGLLYVCRQTHTSQLGWEPPNVYALWAREESDTGGVWAPQVIYQVGDIVTFQGHTYQAIQGHQSQPGWEPPNVPALWKLLH